MDYGTRIRTKRQALGLILQEVANDVGISVSFLNFIEKGKRSPSEAVRQRIEQVLFGEQAEVEALHKARQGLRFTRRDRIVAQYLSELEGLVTTEEALQAAVRAVAVAVE